MINNKPYFCISIFLFLLSNLVKAQGGQYEIQVYGSELVSPHTTMVELHTNYTPIGFTNTDPYGVLADQGVFHETIEITHGWTPYFETGLYFFNTLGSDGRSGYVGSHIRPRFSIPEDMHLPVGLSLSLEAGFQKARYSSDIWTLEIRPVIDKTFFKKLYIALNPVFDKSFKGQTQSQGLVFSPNVKIGYDITKVVNMGFEYYGTLGPLNAIYSGRDQFQQIFLVTDLSFNPKWELNAGIGEGFTPSSEKLVFKVILGRRFGK